MLKKYETVLVNKRLDRKIKLESWNLKASQSKNLRIAKS
jgi:hypothetical protein